MKKLFSRLTIKAKLTALVSIIIAFFLGFIISAISSMNNIGNEITDIAEIDIPITIAITEATTKQLKQAVQLERILRYGETQQPNSATSKLFNTATENFNKNTSAINNDLKHAKKIATQALQSAHNAEQVKEFKHVVSVLDAASKQHASYHSQVQNIIASLRQADTKTALDLTPPAEQLQLKIEQSLYALVVELEKFTEQAALTAKSHETSAIKLLTALAISAIVIISLLAFGLITRINKGISRAIDTAETIAAGDLSKEIVINTHDEIGQLLGTMNTMRTTLRDMISGMVDSASQLAASSEELSAVSEQSTQTLQVQQVEVEQAATAMNQMAATVQEVARSAANTSDTAKSANDTTIGGQRVVQQTISSISELAEDVENAAAVIQKLEADSENIGTVLDVIKGIAEQTNLLALNAAIEAARAGEQGRGFAVVADEVRTLASRTQESTSEIESMIDKLQNGSRQAVKVMKTGCEKAAQSVDQTHQAGTALQEIIGAVSTISDMNTQIASAAEEQATVADEINRNINTVSSLADQNASGARETLAASTELAELAAGLQQTVKRFKI